MTEKKWRLMLVFFCIILAALIVSDGLIFWHFDGQLYKLEADVNSVKGLLGVK